MTSERAVEARGRRQPLRDALSKYGFHTFDCRWEKATCTCGWDTFLADHDASGLHVQSGEPCRECDAALAATPAPRWEELRREIEALLKEPIDYGVSIVSLPAVLAIVDRFALRATPVADTAEPEAPLFFEPCRDFDKPQSCYTNDGTGLWCDPCRERRRVALVADTAGIDAAWREAEAALPKVWRPVFVLQRGSTDRPLSREWLATAEDVDDERTGRIGSGPTPAAALHALAAALRTPKPEGERDAS